MGKPAEQQEARTERNQSYYHCRKEDDRKTRAHSGCDRYFTIESKLSATCPYCGLPLAHIALSEPPTVIHNVQQPSCRQCENSPKCPLCFRDDELRKPDHCRGCVCWECCGHAISLARKMAEAIKNIPAGKRFEYIIQQRKQAEAS